MTAVMHEPSTDMPDRRSAWSRLLVPKFWAALTIVMMWLAVLFVGVFGGDMVFSNPPRMTTIPSVVIVALFAAIATGSVAKRVFGRKGH